MDGDLDLVLRSPLLWFAVMVAAAGLLYLWSRRLAPAPTEAGDKQAPYVGGELAVSTTCRPSYTFFEVAFFFTIAHVGAFVVATAPPDRLATGALVYLGVIALAVGALRWR